jgi:hypothetical protein
MTKLSRAELDVGMAQWTGTTSYTRHGMMRTLLMTEGVMWLQENAECYWLVDAIASHIATNKRLQGEEFQTWDFKREDDDMAPANHPHMLSVTDGNDGPPIVKQEIEYTDFPLPSIRFFVSHDESLEGWVIMLTSEY